MKNPFCMSVYVFGDYTKYIPYYIYSILKSYPDYFVKIFCMDHLSEQENLCLDLIRKNLSTNFEIKEKYFPFPKFRKNKLGKPFRFLIPHEEFSEFENVYLGDVDYLIVKENPSILEGHLEHCKKIGLPYSNQIRPNTKRLTGHHFLIVKEYYHLMQPIIEYYQNHLDEVYNEMKLNRSDEKFLYKIVEKGIGFGKMKENHYRPHHGFHLGIMRTNGFKKYVQEGPTNPFSSLPPYPILRKQLLEYYQDPLFQEIINNNPIHEIISLKEKLQKISEIE
ncbi:hypothetical protein [Bacillus sp. T3]|uniref:hypothetical protein n=1 Tax=Bacillus sp. T3 TaxID=467262 RepID=UPI002980BF27|nr:hypothetical protein [Bacillus sp. T3]